MKLLVYCLIFVAVLYVNANGRDRGKDDGTNHTAYGTLGYGLELLLTKFDVIVNKLQKVEKKINEHQSNHEQGLKEVLIAFRKLEDQVVLNVTEHQNHNQAKVNAKLHKLDQVMERVLQNQYSQPTLSSCMAQLTNTSGTYWIRVKSDSFPIKVYCEQQTYGGGWIVIQHRYDGSLEFYRSWNEFRDGFGDLEKEFWSGLENIHQITKSRRHELMIELKDFNGVYKYAQYDAFEIGSENEQYIVKDVGSYNGTAGDEMRYHNGKKFSTKDRDNDEESRENCADTREGAWWHGDCLDANLNGRYMNATDRKALTWFAFNFKWQGLSFSRMMIRELE